MDVPDRLIISIYYFLLKYNFVKTAKIFVKETHKKYLFIGEEKGISLIEMYQQYDMNKGIEDTMIVEKNYSEPKEIKKSLKKKKEKLLKNTQIDKKIKDQKRKKKLSEKKISVKKHKNEIEKKNIQDKTEIRKNNICDTKEENENMPTDPLITQSNDETKISDSGLKKKSNELNSKEKDIIKEVPKKNAFFSRIDKSKIEFAHECLKDNSYNTTYKGEYEDYGNRANRDFFATKGKEFRAEKSKKKRGSYHGGRIDANASRSFKFT